MAPKSQYKWWWVGATPENRKYETKQLLNHIRTSVVGWFYVLTSPFPNSVLVLRSVTGVFWVDFELGGGQHLFAWHDGWSCVPGSLGQPIAQSWDDHNGIR